MTVPRKVKKCQTETVRTRTEQDASLAFIVLRRYTILTGEKPRLETPLPSGCEETSGRLRAGLKKRVGLRHGMCMKHSSLLGDR